MRDLLFKNSTSVDKKRRRIASSEIIYNQGVCSIIRRHFVYLVKEVKDNRMQNPLSYVHILKERNNREHREKFFVKIKGSMYAANNERLFLILFTHSLKIILTAVPEGSLEYSEEEGGSSI